MNKHERSGRVSDSNPTLDVVEHAVRAAAGDDREGVGARPILTAATNSSGGVMGKMISPQNLSVGAAGVGAVGSEGVIFRLLIGHSLVLTGLVGLLAMLQAYVFTWMLPVW